VKDPIQVGKRPTCGYNPVATSTPNVDDASTRATCVANGIPSPHLILVEQEQVETANQESYRELLSPFQMVMPWARKTARKHHPISQPFGHSETNPRGKMLVAIPVPDPRPGTKNHATLLPALQV